MVQLRFKAQVSLVIEGRNHPIGAPHPRYAGGKKLAGKLNNKLGLSEKNSLTDNLDLSDADTSAEPVGFYLTAWVGGASKAYDIVKLDGRGEAELCLDVDEGSPDTVKLGVSYACSDEKGPRNYNLASNFSPVEDFVQLVKGTQGCMSMSSNFERNTAVVRLSDAGTDFKALGALRLRRSVLRDRDALNGDLIALGQKMKRMISQSSVMAFNAGTQFIDNLTYLPMENMASTYGTLGYSFTQMGTGVTDGWVVYDAYKTLECVPVRLAALASLSDEQLVDHFGVHMLMRHTSCELTAPYSSDVALDAEGYARSPTEDIGRSMCCTQVHVQGATQVYRPPGAAAGRPDMAQSAAGRPDFSACLKGLGAVVDAQQRAGASMRMSSAVLKDDCENLSSIGLAKAAALTRLCGDWREKGPDALARHMESMSGPTAPNRHLFARLTPSDHRLMAPVLLRLGALLDSGDWGVGFTVVSAKGPSYDVSDTNGTQLNGHGTLISRHRCANGQYAHQPLEGTSYITCDRTRSRDLPPKINVRLNDNTTHAFDLAELGTVLSQNMYTVAGISRFSRVLGHINDRYDDPLADCPFYVAAFYSSLPMGKKTIGCVPFQASSQSQSGHIFGAPVIGLSSASTVAAPICSEELERSDTLRRLQEQANEAWPPEASARQVQNIMSFWQPCDTVDYSSQTLDAGRCLRGECNSAFDDPQHTAMAATVYKAVAARFNALQV